LVFAPFRMRLNRYDVSSRSVADMRRRGFLGLLGGAAGYPLLARAQQAAMPVIGFLSGRSAGESATVVAAFRRGLAEQAYNEGKNVAVEYRWADGRYDQLPALAAELVDRHVVAIAATGGSVSGLAAKATTATIPIVFSSGGDAVKLGLVASLNRPGGNVTGVNLIFGALGAKRLELLHEVTPSVAKLAVLVNPNYPSAADEVDSVRTGARSLGLQIVSIEAAAESDFPSAFARLTQLKIAGLLVTDDPFLQSRRDQLVALAAQHAIPAIYFSRDFCDAGGLISYGPDISDAYRLVGVYIGRVLKGEKPVDLPVIQPTKFELVINLKTAKALGLEIPPTLLSRADEVIE
jgi:putative tryptophan/tyrosine transport system substrate-binding protein